jgi:DNA-binding SARP family transcriptional activator
MLPAMTVPYRLRLLGGLELRLGDAAAMLPSRRSAALLACIAVDAAATRAVLAERLWAGLGTAMARRNLRRELARLREAGLGDLVETTQESLTLSNAVACDVRVFVEACQRGDSAAALAAWRGQLLEGFVLAEATEFDAWLSQQRSAFAARWRDAAAAQADHLEQGGALREALGLHARLREDDPVQERHYAAAMRLHYRLGEPAAALAIYGQCARVLREQLGIEPSPATSALAQRSRAAEALHPIVARRTRSVTPALEPELIGREAEAATVRDTEAAVLLVEGDAGVGKSRLVQDCLRAPSTLVACCDPASQQAALHPVAEALRFALLSPQRADRVAALPPAVRREAARLLPALDDHGPRATGVGTESAGPTEAQRDRFFDALGDTIDHAAGAGGVLWIDDLQWADDATLELLARLARRRASAPARHVRIVVAARTPEIELNAAALVLLRRLQRARLLERLVLRPFGLPQTLALLCQLSGTAARLPLAERLQRATGGNPYHVLETLRFLFDEGELRVEADGSWASRGAADDEAELPLPPTLADTVTERAERLPQQARRLLDVAALCRSGFTLAQLRSAAMLDEWQALEAMEAVLKLRLFSDAPCRGGNEALRYRFVHSLAREVVALALPPERRRLIHERLARVLISLREAADHVAWHLEEAGQTAEAAGWRLAAAAESRRLFAWRGALAHLSLADAATKDPDARLPIVRDRWHVARNLLDLTALDLAARDLAQLAHEAQREDWRLEALLWQADLAQMRKQPDTAIEPLRRALEEGAFGRSAPSLLARAAAALAHLLLAAGQIGAAEQVLARIDADGIADDDRAMLLTASANAARLAGNAAGAQQLLSSAIELMRSPQRLEERLQARNLLAHTQQMRGDAAGARRTLEAALEEAERAQLTSALRTVLPNLVTLCAVEGQLDRAQAFLRRGMEALKFVDHPAVHAMLNSRLAEVLLRSGDLGGTLDAAECSMRHYETNRGGTQDYAPWIMAAQVHVFADDVQGALGLFDSLERSPARMPGPGTGALVQLKRLALRVRLAQGADAVALAQELERIRDAPDHAYRATEADYWRAQALLRAGAVEAAWALAGKLPAGELGLHLEEASLLALQLSCAAALGRVDAAQVDFAVEALAKAPPLPALELAHALLAAQRALGRHQAAGPIRGEIGRRVDRLAATLSRQPELSQGLRRRWGEPTWRR